MGFRVSGKQTFGKLGNKEFRKAGIFKDMGIRDLETNVTRNSGAWAFDNV